LRKLPPDTVRGRVRGWIERHADKLGDDVLEVGSRLHIPGAWWCVNRDLARGAWLGIFPAAGGTLRSSVAFHVLADTPGSDRVVAKLSSACQATQLSGPGTYRVRRPAYTGTAFGVYLET
jgi:hypothetical protein